MVIWGALTLCMALIKDFSHLVILRVFVGIVESGFSPGILLIISSWYKREEQSKRFAVYMSAAILSGAFGGLLAGAITGGLDGAHGIRGWRWLFIVEGAATIGWALIAFFVLLDFPANSKGLTEREREIAIARLQDSGVRTHVDGEERLGHWTSFKLAITDWRVGGLILGYMVSLMNRLAEYGSNLSQGHCWLIDPFILLPNSCTRARVHRHRTSPVYDSAHLCCSFCLYSHHRFLRR